MPPSPTPEKKVDRNACTSLRIYLGVPDDHDVRATAERLADALIDLGFNADGEVTAAIACVAETEDVTAFAGGAESFVAAMGNLSSFVLIPDRGGRVA